MPRPTFKTGLEFAIWAINAPDAEVSLDLKMRAMQCLLLLEAKGVGKTIDGMNKKIKSDTLYTPRNVRAFGVVSEAA